MEQNPPEAAKDSSSADKADDAGKETTWNRELVRKCVAEAFGTGLIVLFGVGSVNTAVLTGAQQGIWQVAVVWGLGIAIAIILTAPISGAHLNPAVSVAFALFRPKDFPKNELLPYILSQFFGAFLFAFLNYLIFSKPITAFHRVNGIDQFNDDNAILTAMVFGEYFPNPAFLSNPNLGWTDDTVNFWNSLLIEAIGTCLLVVVIFSVTSDKNNAVHILAAPFVIGFTVSAMISLWAPLNQAGFNPARDFGPRLASVFLGYESIGIPGPNYDVFPYLIGPFVGAIGGGAFFKYILEPGY